MFSGDRVSVLQIRGVLEMDGINVRQSCEHTRRQHCARNWDSGSQF